MKILIEALRGLEELNVPDRLLASFLNENLVLSIDVQAPSGP